MKFKTKIFADGADLKMIAAMNKNPYVKGFTTNPSLMRKAGVTDYVLFAKEALKIVGEKPISFEVFADDFYEMEAQAHEIASWGNNVYVKIPITNTKGESATPLIEKLSKHKIPLNITAILTHNQVEEVVKNLYNAPAIISVFAGRIADTGIDPVPFMKTCLSLIKNPLHELLWASSREIFNLMQAEQMGCPIITLGADMIQKIALFNKNLEEYSLETVKTFYSDAMASKFEIPVKANV